MGKLFHPFKVTIYFTKSSKKDNIYLQIIFCWLRKSIIWKVEEKKNIYNMLTKGRNI